MSHKYLQLSFTDAVKESQVHFGARAAGANDKTFDLDDDRLSFAEADFIAARDGFYMATVNADGWPYVQYRGGPTGFLNVLDNATLGFADFRGNRQYISTGNLTENDRVALFFMDYANQRRLKVMARTEVFDANEHPDLLEKVRDEAYAARIERVVVFHVVAFDWNCPQHITPRFTQDEWNVMTSKGES